MNQAEWERHALDVAVARHGVIAPLVSRTMTEEERAQVMRQVLDAVHRLPGGREGRVSARSVRRWCRWYAEGHRNDKGELVSEPGLEALKPQGRTDRGVPRRADPALVERAVRLRQEEPKRTTGTILEILKREALARGEQPPDVREATLAFHLRRLRATRRDLKREGRAYPRYEHPHRNAVWQGDWSQGLPLPDPQDPKRTRMSHLHVFLDDHSRFIPHGEFYFRQNLPCLEDCFRKAILKGGIPSRAYFDNGAVYQARQVQLVAARLNVQVIFATPYSPEGKGKVERFFRYCKESFYPEARRAGLSSLEELNQFFWGWLEEVYHSHRHSQTEQTPRERWEAGADGVRWPAPGSLADVFLWEEERLVDRAGCVSLSGNAYPAGEHLVGRKVVLRFDPFDTTRVRLYVDGTFVEVLQTQEVVSRTYRKALPRRHEKPSPLESSRTFREQVSESYRREVEATLAQSRQAGGLTPGWLTRAELAALLVEALGGRSLTVGEAAQVSDFFGRFAPLPAEAARAALRRAVEEKGTTRHLRFYLEAVGKARLQGDRP
jgi:transposase InsO family protein